SGTTWPGISSSNTPGWGGSPPPHSDEKARGRLLHPEDGAVQGEVAHVVLSVTVDGEFRRDLSEQGRELEAVRGAQQQDDVGVLGEPVHHEVPVRRHGVWTGAE